MWLWNVVVIQVLKHPSIQLTHILVSLAEFINDSQTQARFPVQLLWMEWNGQSHSCYTGKNTQLKSQTWCDSQKTIWCLMFLTSTPDLDVVWVGHRFIFWLQIMKGEQMGIPNSPRLYCGVDVIWWLKHSPRKWWLRSSTSSFPLLLPREACPRCGCRHWVLPAAGCRIPWFTHCSG